MVNHYTCRGQFELHQHPSISHEISHFLSVVLCARAQYVLPPNVDTETPLTKSILGGNVII